MFINFLNCSGNITSCCTSTEISYFVVIFKRIYLLIEIIAPILLIIALVYKLILLSRNPDDKKLPKQIINSLMATAIIFFIPVIVNVVLRMLPEQIEITACILASEDTYSFSNPSYKAVGNNGDEDRKKIINDDEYEKGVKKPEKQESSSNKSNSSSSSSKSNSSSDSDYSGKATDSTPGSLTNVKYNNGGMPIPIYYQGDFSSVSLKPGTDRTVATSGCGFTSISMIVSYLLNQRITPKEFVADWSRKYYIYNQGMAYSGFQGAANHYNLGKIEQTTSSSRMVEALRNNQPVVSNQRAGLFTSGGHYIVLRGVTSSGKILVNDPNKRNAVSKGYNNREFSVSEIQQANKMYFIFPKKK